MVGVGAEKGLYIAGGMRRKTIKKSNYFPNISKKNHTVSSDQDTGYNCIAYAAGDTGRWWWPLDPFGYWPANIPRTDSPESFVRAFETLGYRQCADGKQAKGKEKIALYTRAGRVRHAARMDANGRWLSKLGKGEDIHHELLAVAGDGYGDPTVFMERPTGS